MVNAHSTFRFIREQHVASLNIDVQEFEHIETGAQHIHLNPRVQGEGENVFLVALRTVPHDSTGVAHILEHTALCGSKKYPVRDPFFMMTRRSINTFMNAFTSSDWTAYPFASLNKKDFNNLLDVYLDAVFFARLDELDFAQEGHRLEFSEPENTDSPLEFKGVVFNEMKGAMSSVPSQLWQTVCKYLFPTTTYHYNSGGDPECIPDLSYEELKEFYETHYHPSNAIFMTYGDISAATHQEKFENQALSHFERLNHTISVPDEKRYCAPIRVEERYPNNDEDSSEKTHVVIGWLLGKSTALRDSLRAQLLSSVLLDNSATPLMHALESSDLGAAPSPMCGLDSSQKEMSFLCGLAGCKADAADKVEALVRSTLEKIAEEGIPQEDVESALHQLELQQREIGGDSYPYGLQIILTALNNATHRGDPVRLLNIDEELQQLRKDVQTPGFINTLVKDLLLDNQHNIRLTMVPDNQLSERKTQLENARLEAIKQNLTEEEKQKIVERAAQLKERQSTMGDESILPKVTLADVPKSETEVPYERTEYNGIKTSQYAAGTNGLVYQQVIYDLPQLSDEQLPLLSLYSTAVTELGAKEHSYLDIQRLQASVCGSFNAFSSIRTKINTQHEVAGYYAFSGKALNRKQKELSEVMQLSIEGAKFTEHKRIAELVSQIKAHQDQAITGSGHSLAMVAASSGMCGMASMSHKTSGLAGIRAIRELNASLKSDDALEEISSKFADIHSAITASEKQILLIGEQEQLNQSETTLAPLIASNGTSTSAFSLESAQAKVNEAWICNTQVNFCARAFPTVTMQHEDSAALVILGGFLRNGFLHTAIRERGGAYGGGASQDNNIGAFRFYSYRDPRLEETLNDFNAAIEWLMNEDHASSKVEEAILGVISSLDKSESPSGRAKRSFHAELHGRTTANRQIFRERVLSTTIDDLRRVASTYLVPEKASTAVITNNQKLDSVKNIGLDIQELL